MYYLIHCFPETTVSTSTTTPLITTPSICAISTEGPQSTIAIATTTYDAGEVEQYMIHDFTANCKTSCRISKCLSTLKYKYRISLLFLQNPFDMFHDLHSRNDSFAVNCNFRHDTSGYYYDAKLNIASPTRDYNANS